jgi:hypothetical protein
MPGRIGGREPAVITEAIVYLHRRRPEPGRMLAGRTDRIRLTAGVARTPDKADGATFGVQVRKTVRRRRGRVSGEGHRHGRALAHAGVRLKGLGERRLDLASGALAPSDPLVPPSG